jgi:hypothetical protein
MFLTAGLPHSGALQRLHVSTPGKLSLCFFTMLAVQILTGADGMHHTW